MKNTMIGIGLLIFSGSAIAGNFYIGAGAGVTTGSADVAGARDASTALGATVTSTSSDTEDTSTRAFVGYNFNKRFGIELGYADLGEGSITVRDDISTFTTDHYKASINGVGLALGMNFPLVDKLSGMVKVGVFSWKSDITADIDTGSSIITVGTSEDGTAPMFGVGLVYHFNPTFGLRAEFEHMAIDKEEAGAGDVNSITANAVLSF